MSEMNRRGFLELAGASALGAFGGQQISADAGREFDAYGLLVGPAGARPDANGAYFREFDTYQFAYFAVDEQNQYWIDHTRDHWHTVGRIVQHDNQLYFRRQP